MPDSIPTVEAPTPTGPIIESKTRAEITRVLEIPLDYLLEGVKATYTDPQARNVWRLTEAKIRMTARPTPDMAAGWESIVTFTATRIKKDGTDGIVKKGFEAWDCGREQRDEFTALVRALRAAHVPDTLMGITEYRPTPGGLEPIA